jgi:hypothetical protein
MRYDVSGTSTYEYRIKPNASGVWGAWTPLSGPTDTFGINNSSGIDELWDIESRHTFTPTQEVYPPGIFTKLTTITVEPTTQFAFTSAYTSPATFASGTYRIRVAYTETPVYSGPGTRTYIGDCRLLDDAGNTVLESLGVVFTDIGGGVLESTDLEAPVLYDTDVAAEGSIEVDITASISGTPIENDDSLSAADVWTPSDATMPDFNVAAHSAVQEYDYMSGQDGFTVEVAVTDDNAILTPPTGMRVYMHVRYMDAADVVLLGEKDVELPWDAGLSVFKGHTGDGQELFSLSYDYTKIHIQCFAQIDPPQPEVPTGSNTEAYAGEIFRYF